VGPPLLGAAAASPARSARAWTALPRLALAALAISLSLHQIRSYDYWWHLLTGALIAETGSVPQVDPYTYTVAGARWIDVHWLYQLGLHGVFELGGHEAVVLAKAALVLAMLGLLGGVGRRRGRGFVTAGALGLLLLVACLRIMPRPELVSFVLLAAVVALLERFARRGDCWLYAIVPIQLVWANLHGLFALGVALCALHLLAEGLRPLLKRDASLRPQRVRRLAAVTVLAALVSVANPNGLEAALYPLRQLAMIGPAAQRDALGLFSAELAPPFGGPGPLVPLHASFFVALAGLSLLAMGLNWRRLEVRDGLTWLAFLVLALGAQRNVAIFGIVAVPVLVRNLNAWLDRHPLGGAGRLSAAAGVTLLLAVLAADAARGGFYPRLRILREPGLGFMRAMVPIAAADWIEAWRPPGPIAHHMSSGGYLIWRLFPEYPVMSDGRLEVFGARKFLELRLHGPEEFPVLDWRYDFGAVIVPFGLGLRPHSQLLWFLYEDARFGLVAVDEGGALFVRRRGDATLPELDVDAPDLFPPLGRDRSGQRLLARVHFYTALRRHRRALAIYQVGCARSPRALCDPALHAALRRMADLAP